MAEYYNTPRTKWYNQSRSYWIPIRGTLSALAYIRTSIKKALIKIGSRWVSSATSERVD